MFDGPTTPGLRLDAPLVVLDLAAVYHSPALGVLMACAAAWLQNAVRTQHRNRIIVVVDEAWAILSKASMTPCLAAATTSTHVVTPRVRTWPLRTVSVTRYFGSPGGLGWASGRSLPKNHGTL
jgi:hypothetical protein